MRNLCLIGSLISPPYFFKNFFFNSMNFITLMCPLILNSGRTHPGPAPHITLRWVEPGVGAGMGTGDDGRPSRSLSRPRASPEPRAGCRGFDGSGPGLASLRIEFIPAIP